MGKNIYPKDLSKNIMDSIEVPQVSTTKGLGVFVDDTLSWKEQADYMRRKIHKSTGIIRRVRHLVTTECFLMLYYSLIYLYLSYYNIVWESTFSTTLRIFFVLQKHFLGLQLDQTNILHLLLYFINFWFLPFMILILFKYVFS